MNSTNQDQEYVLKPNLASAMLGSLTVAGTAGLIAGTVAGYLMTSFIAGIAVFTGLTVLMTVFRFLNLKNTEYRFEARQLEYYQGFLNITQSNLAYDRITDVSLQQPVTQRIFGTGSIMVNTAGSDAQEINIGYIDNPEEEFNKIKSIAKK